MHQAGRLPGFYPGQAGGQQHRHRRYIVLALAIPSTNEQHSSIAATVMTGTEPLSYLPILTTLCASLLLILGSLNAYNRQEF